MAGTFTAAVRGMYYFHFSMFSSQTPDSSGGLRKNGEFLASLRAVEESTGHNSGSNAVVVPLEAGDRVTVHPDADRTVSDNESRFNTFSGFLIFTM